MRKITRDINLIELYSYRAITVSYFIEENKFIGVYSVACNLNRNTGVKHDSLADCKKEIFEEAQDLVNSCLNGGALVRSDMGEFFKFYNEAKETGQQALFF